MSLVPHDLRVNGADWSLRAVGWHQTWEHDPNGSMENMENVLPWFTWNAPRN